GMGPTLLEMKTYRYRGHSRTDPAKYRTSEELEQWRARDPIRLLRERLVADGNLTSEAASGIESAVRADIDRAASEALESPVLEMKELSSLFYSNKSGRRVDRRARDGSHIQRSGQPSAR